MLLKDDSGFFRISIKKNHEAEGSEIISLSKPNDVWNLARIFFNYRWCSRRPIKDFKSLSVRDFWRRIPAMTIFKKNKMLMTDLMMNTKYIFSQHNKKVFQFWIVFFLFFWRIFRSFFFSILECEISFSVRRLLCLWGLPHSTQPDCLCDGHFAVSEKSVRHIQNNVDNDECKRYSAFSTLKFEWYEF